MAAEVDLKATSALMQKGLNFIQHEQFAKDTGVYNQGEWPVNMRSYLIPSVVGLGRSFSQPTDEPTAFVTSTVINMLTEVHQLKPELTGIPQIIDLGLPSLKYYREGDVFHYYPMSDYFEVKMHGPRGKGYVPRHMRSFALVPPDADTTSVSLMALANAEWVKNGTPVSQFKVPEATLKTLADFRDLDRKPYFFNSWHGAKNTGAYMTWLWDEHDPTSSLYRSMADKPKKGYRIVFGRNDVDCVVNANVLRMLKMTGNEGHEGFEQSCQYLNRMIEKDEMRYCAPYYPNTLNTFYSISNVYKAGASCISRSRDQAIKKILSRQNEDGSWKNDEGFREDRINSTSWALLALLNYVEPTDRSLDYVVRLGVEYLKSQALAKGQDQAYWPGEVFFAGSALARSTLLWRSDAYTTALATLALAKSEKYLKGGR